MSAPHCDHKFVGSNNCAKCGTHVRELKRIGELEAQVLRLESAIDSVATSLEMEDSWLNVRGAARELKAELRPQNRLGQEPNGTPPADLGGARLSVLERIAKYAREDRAVTPGCTRLARALDELDELARRAAKETP